MAIFGVLVLLIAAGVFWTVQPLISARRREPGVDGADPARLAQDVQALVLSHSPRDFAHPENLRGASEYLASRLRLSGARVRFQEFVAAGTRFRNVIAELGPDSPERVVVGAHYDTDGPLPGADDNASGVAGVLELARLLATKDLEVRVELVAYAPEEMPFFGSEQMGSAVHAGFLRASGARVRAMISLEMIGYFSDQPRSQGFPYGFLRAFYPDRGNFIAVVGRLRDGLLVRRLKRAMLEVEGLDVRSINAPRFVPGVDLSDHASYWRRGFPAVMITDTAFYRNPHYHTAEDLPEKLDYRRMAAVVEAVCAAVMELNAD